ncbi:SAM-dependent methyltransferase [Kitasatospora sp. NPDC056783]|uniref:SAM-dependent methyltransferase n=1 Tax=Kitasatospora sp. NPDC056783 TaxID=3345943 RepID=UPI0036A3B3BE
MTPPAPVTAAAAPDRTLVDQVIDGLLTTARSCRVTNYYIGGSDSFPVDRATGLAFMRWVPNAPDLAFHARAFTEHSVRALAREHGIRQFLDLGCGLPLHSHRNTHEIAQAIAADSTAVYVDNDPLVLAHARLYLHSDRTAVVDADLANGLRPVLEHPKAQALLDPGRPVAVLLCSTLETLPDEALPAALLADLPALLPASSFVVLTHLVSDDAHVADRASALMQEQIAGGWGRIRSRDEVAALVAGLPLLGPGLTDLTTLPPRAPAVRTDLRVTGPSPVTVLGAVAHLDPSLPPHRQTASRCSDRVRRQTTPFTAAPVDTQSALLLPSAPHLDCHSLALLRYTLLPGTTADRAAAADLAPHEARDAEEQAYRMLAAATPGQAGALTAAYRLLTPQQIGLALVPGPATLSPRHLRALTLVTGGLPESRLADHLGLQESFAQALLRAAARAFGVHTAAHLGYAAVATGTVRLDAVHPAIPRLPLPDALTRNPFPAPAGDCR